MIAKVYISMEKFKNKPFLPGFLLEELYLQYKIDKDYYDIIIDSIERANSKDLLGYDFYIYYNKKETKYGIV